MFHTYLTILIPSVVGAIVTLVATMFLMKYMKYSGITLVDHNKKSKPVLPTGLGFAIAFGFSVGLMVYIFGSSFGLYTPVASLEDLFGIITAVLLITIVGFIDDINIRMSNANTEDKVGSWAGLKQWQKPILTFMGAIPLMAINAGISIVRIPLVGNIALSIYYPLVVVPLAIMFGANAFNLLGGFDGIATGTGTVAIFALLIYSLIFGTYTGALISAILFASMLIMRCVQLYIFLPYLDTKLPSGCSVPRSLLWNFFFACRRNSIIHGMKTIIPKDSMLPITMSAIIAAPKK